MNSDHLPVQLNLDYDHSLPSFQSAYVCDLVAFTNSIIDASALFNDINSIRDIEDATKMLSNTIAKSM